MVLPFIFLVLALFFAITAVSGAPWVPVRKFDMQELMDDSKLQKGQNYLELGCGEGRLVLEAAKRGAKAVGYELNPVLWLIAWLRCLGTSNAKVRFGNMWNVDLGKADVVMAFLVPRTMPRLGIKAKKEMKKGSRLVSYIFEIPGEKPELHNKSWYIYTFSKSKAPSAQK